MIKTNGYAAPTAAAALEPFSFDRRDVGARDVLIDIQYCGVCHSDIHQVRDEWGGSIYPMVPGHEIVGRVARVGAEVSKFKEGDLAGVGCFVDSCRTCRNCRDGEEQYCENHLVATYNGTEKDEKTPTYGGYSTKIVIDEDYALRIPEGLPLGERRAAALRGHHDLLAAAPLQGERRAEGRRRRPRRARATWA